MLGFDQGGEVFFDAAESFSFETSVSGYGIWLKEPKSVKERRDSFFSKMGFVVEESETTQRVMERVGAITSSCGSSTDQDNFVSDCRESNGEANCMVGESAALEWSDNISIWTEEEPAESPCCIDDLEVEDHKNVGLRKKKMKGWLNTFMHKLKKSKSNTEASKEEKVTQLEVQQKQKKFMEFTAVYAGQEINGHNGLISTMKFSPDGQYIATGGEDGIVRVWSVSLTEAAYSATSACNTGGSNDRTRNNSRLQKKKSANASVVIPEKVFHINESPLREFHGHSSEILDLSWSSSNQILSASEDNTVRLWQVGSNECLSVFLHTNYVTCVQFNPVDENYFISGCIDGKIRIWEVPQKRVVDWANSRDVVSAVCYQPNGKGFVAGFVSGICRFYELQGTEPFLQSEIHGGGKKKSSGNRIKGIQFLGNDSQRFMITSEDSKIRVLDGLDVVQKYQAPAKSGSQTSASFTSNGQHIVSVGEDSRVYVWTYDNQHFPSSRAKKPARSCEYFSSECASIAIPWSGVGTEKPSADCLLTQRQKGSSHPGARDQDRFSMAIWFSMDVSAKSRVTWPEEKLPVWEVPFPEQSYQTSESSVNEHKNINQNCGKFSATWGTVIITAGWDGKIRTFHNFGLPLKV